MLEENGVIDLLDVYNGKWDGARYEINQYNFKALEDGPIPGPHGKLGNHTPQLGSAIIEIRDLRQALQPDTTRRFQATCPYRLGDVRCTVDLAPFTVTGTVGTVISQRQFSSDLTEADDWFALGELTWVTGLNADRSRRVRYYADGSFTLAEPMIYAIAEGDTFDAIAGCRKRKLEDCRDKFDNILNYGGQDDRSKTDEIIAPPSEAPLAVAPAPAPAPVPAPSPAPPATGKPNTSVIAYKLKRPSSDAEATALGTAHGRAKRIITGFYYDFAPSRINAYMTAVAAAGSAKVANYFIPSEVSDTSAHASYRTMLNTVRSDGRDGWMRNAAGSRGYEFPPQYEVNLTASVPTLDGKTIARWFVESIVAEFDGYGFDAYFIDNLFAIARRWTGSALYDYTRDGANDATSSDPAAAINVAERVGRALVVSEIRSLSTVPEVWANTTGHHLDAAQYVGTIDRGFLEGHNRYGGSFASMMATYAAQEANTISGEVDIEWQGGATEYSKVRFGFFYLVPGSDTQHWYDEFDQVIGSPIDAAQTASRHNGCWLREYDNALVIINPTASAQTIEKTFLDTLGAWERFTGTQDPATNNGAAISADFILAAGDGLLLMRQ